MTVLQDLTWRTCDKRDRPAEDRRCPVCDQPMEWHGYSHRLIVMRWNHGDQTTDIRETAWWRCESCNVNESVPYDYTLPMAEAKQQIKTFHRRVLDGDMGGH